MSLVKVPLCCPEISSSLERKCIEPPEQYTYLHESSPQGVGMGRKPQVWLKDGDVVEVNLEGVGSCINKVEFAKTKARL